LTLAVRSWRNAAAVVLGLLAVVQMVGDMLGVRALVGLGAAWGFSPRPKVFSDVDGMEPFASTFTLRWREASGAEREMRITPELYSRLAGPYVRRNVYGAALSYAPRLPRSLWEPVFCYGLRGGGPLRQEFGLPPSARDLTVEIRTLTRGRDESWSLQAPCTR